MCGLNDGFHLIPSGCSMHYVSLVYEHKIRIPADPLLIRLRHVETVDSRATRVTHAVELEPFIKSTGEFFKLQFNHVLPMFA